MGAFATEDMECGTVVTAMEDPVVISIEEADRLENYGIYSTIQITRYMYSSLKDANLTGKYSPVWFWFNHKTKTNMWVSARNGNLAWIATRFVKSREELTWSYNTPRYMKGAFLREDPLTLN